MNVDQQFNALHDKLQLMLKQFARLQKDNEKLRGELDAAQAKQEQTLQQMDVMQQQISILKLAAGDLPEKEKKEFEKKISFYIREIDKCISYLSQ
ncbi:MAG TPA: hypothetical protein VFZ78_02105 [Flavisolibacter sp.]